ncbi:hypothetical protein AAHC03_026508 [Spirometra sp. Aus1]
MNFTIRFNSLNALNRQSLRLVIVADDGFYAEERDRGIVECLQPRVSLSSPTRRNDQTEVNACQTSAVSAVSVLMNGAVARRLRDASSPSTGSCLMDFLRANDSALGSVGLHINLTEGASCLEARRVPSLLGTDGLFHGKVGFRRRLKDINLAQVELEVERQLLAFEGLFSVPPFRADGHQHVHVLPGVREVLARILPRHGVRWIRVPEEALLIGGISDDELAGLVDQSALTFYREVSDQAAVARTIFQSAGLRCTDAFAGMLTMGRNLTADSLRRSLTAILKRSHAPTVELMTHPGYPLTETGPENQGCADSLGPDDFSRSIDRAHEMAVLQSSEFSEVVRAFSGQLYGFSDFA